MIDNYNDFKELLKKLNNKPTLLLHACCAPCSSHCIMLLKDYFDISIFFSNDNIYPKSEYDKRLNEIIKFSKNFDIKVVYEEYNDNDYYNAVKGLENHGEKSDRCYECYKLRMSKTAKYAKLNNFDYFSTTLSISPHKIEKWINEIGYKLEDEYKINYLYSNFKKEDGYKNSIILSRQYDLYRQDYCGCVFSLNERDNKNGA